MAEPQKKKRKYTKKEAQQALPSIKEFNKLASTFLNLLNQKVEQKQKRLSTISVLLDGSVRIKRKKHDINIQAVDLKSTLLNKKKGTYSYNQAMNWEEDFRRNRKRGIVL
jgi:hypothetical protein